MTQDTQTTDPSGPVILPGAEPNQSEPAPMADDLAQSVSAEQAGDEIHTDKATAHLAESAEIPPAIPMVSQASYDILANQLAAFEDKLNNTLRQYQEAKQDFEDSKRRMQRDLQKELHQVKKTVLLPLLDTLDDLQRALSAPAGETAEAIALHQGVEMVTNRFMKTLEKQGVRSVPLEGEQFDPNLCEAASIMPVQEKQQDGIIMAVIRSCYLLEQEVLRNGMVIVGKHHPQGLTTDNTESEAAEELVTAPPSDPSPLPNQPTT